MKLANRGHHRLFFALDFEDDFKQQLHSWSINQPIDGRRVELNNLHLTLLFLGSIKNHQVYDIIDNVELPEIPTFDISVQKTGYFPKQEILFCEISEGEQEVMHISRVLSNSMQQLKSHREKKRFVPHITLARDAKPPVDFPITPTLSTRIDRFCLMESIQVKSGMHYETVESWPLKTMSEKEIILGRSLDG
ncbi:RNA 2',3'-cyclic phosphodiesterase [Pleionea litopenaei]|uniref:RNA 2',3'-cyclic phosphodiesterase n=1 Tax=Pleionea litopenaei TaxID=3070815 RepID=A0AA51RWX6_9GAMM|nr:RNA 2',3'-cyclic phosphodiesterase [Pleionea sp. HL-JVS1]WMS89161.1 RNA 2',3'-cyclic phosphodiesterase [Pleionea sp. HL-JVS1]